MANIRNLRLTIDPVPNSIMADVRVRYDVVFDAFDQQSNLAYQDTLELVGDDDGR